jgi:hypothetical protein
VKPLLLLILCCAACARVFPAEAGLADALRAMPLPPGTRINRENAMEVILDALQSNTVVKAIVILPGVADDFYLIHRDAPKLNLRAANLLEAITVLTNATEVRATFQQPFFLLYVQRDALNPACVAEDERIARTLKNQVHLRHACWKDMHWENIQPAVQKALSRTVKPKGPSSDAWHFSRHNLAGWELSDWELLNALSLAAGTKVTVQKKGIVFAVRGTP